MRLVTVTHKPPKLPSQQASQSLHPPLSAPPAIPLRSEQSKGQPEPSPYISSTTLTRMYRSGISTKQLQTIIANWANPTATSKWTTPWPVIATETDYSNRYQRLEKCIACIEAQNTKISETTHELNRKMIQTQTMIKELREKMDIVILAQATSECYEPLVWSQY